MDDRAASAWAVVLAGGEGVRLRSVTRAIVGDDRPKQYVPLISGDSLLRQTLTRAAGLSPRERTVVVSQQHHAGWLAAELSAHRGLTLLLQPENRDTAAGVLLPVYWIAARDPDATVVVYPSDHFVFEEAAFMAHVAEVVAFVDRQRDGIVLLGARAMEPDTEYGWIEPGGPRRCHGVRLDLPRGPLPREADAAGGRHVPGPGMALEYLRHGGEGAHARVRRRRAPARASPSSHGPDAVPWHATRGVGARAGLRVPPLPQLLRDGPAGRDAVSLGVGAAAADLVRSRNAAAAVQAPQALGIAPPWMRGRRPALPAAQRAG